MSDSSPIMIPKDIPTWMYEAFRRLSRKSLQITEQLAAVGRGETPDGTGSPLVNLTDYLYLPGRVGGQIAHGGSAASDSLTLVSTKSSSRGFIYLGAASTSAFDETNQRLGIGTGAPTALLDLRQTGTTLYDGIGNVVSFAGGWTANDGFTATTGSQDTWSYINETTINDATYLGRTPGVGASTSTYGGITVATPAPTATVRIRVRFRVSVNNSGTAGFSGNVTLYDNTGTGRAASGNVVIIPSGLGATDSGWVNVDYTLSAAEVAAITAGPGWSNMRLRAGSAGGGFGYSEVFTRISWLGMEVVGYSAVDLIAGYDPSLVLTSRMDSFGKIGIGTGSTALSAMLSILPSQISMIGQLITGASGQTARLLKLQNSGGTELGGFTHLGEIFLIAGAGSGKVMISSAAGVGSWALASSLATRISHAWKANGPYQVGTTVDGTYVSDTALTITSVKLWRRTAGASGTTTVLLKKNGSTIATIDVTSANGSDFTDSQDVSLSVVAGDKLTIDISTIETGTPLDLVLIIEGA